MKPQFHPDIPVNCPTNGAEAVTLALYRVVFNATPITDDFRLWIHEPENIQRQQTKISCNMYAISMFSGYAMRRKEITFKRQMQKKSVRRGTNFVGWAEVQLDQTSGEALQTNQNSGHYDLWPYNDSDLVSQVVSVSEF